MKKKLNYQRTADSPYQAGSPEDMALSKAYASRSQKNRANLAAGLKAIPTTMYNTEKNILGGIGGGIKMGHGNFLKRMNAAKKGYSK